jgi:hypothetical protein
MRLEYSRQEIEKKLLLYDEIVSIQWPIDYNFRPVNTSLWTNHSEQHERYVKELEKYLEQPLIIDIFKDHMDRRIWKNRLDTRNDFEARCMFEMNSLRYGRIYPIPHLCAFLDRTLLDKEAVITERIDKIKEAIPSDSDQYDLNPLEKKIELVEDIKANLYEILSCFYEPP